MRETKGSRALRAVRRADELLARHALALGLCVAVLLSLAAAAYNLTAGPLHSLNDIGGWRNRLLFTAMAGAAHLSLLAIAALLCREGALRVMLRQLIVTAGFLILLLAINQKTYAYQQTVQPIVRAMDGAGLRAAAGADTNLSAPALTLLYLITRGPVYDMYLVKLFAIWCDALLALFAAYWADKKQMGIRAEAALTLCLILPQGFMSAACAAEFEHAALLLLALSLWLTAGIPGRKAKPLAGALCLGSAVALSGIALYAAPVYALLACKKKTSPAHLLCGASLAVMLCVPAIVCGMPAGKAIGSLLRANTGIPGYASGAPSMLALLPRAAVEEMEAYFVLGRLPALDLEAGSQVYYTPAHMAVAMRSLTLLGPALLLGAWALALRGGRMSLLRGALALMTVSLLVCPNATSSAWLAADMLCVLALLAEPGLRIPACLTLFATVCACAYPVTGEALLGPVLALALCGAAALMLLGVFGMPAQEVGADG